MTIKHSFAWWSFATESITPDALIRAAADLGYDGIEMAPQEHWQVIKDHGLTLVNTQGHPLIAAGLNRREHLPAIETELKAKLELAQSWGLPQLICFSGERQGLADDEGLDVTAESLMHLAPLAEDAGIVLTLEVLNSKVNHPDYQADKTAWAAEVCRRVDSPNVKILYDIYHMQIMEGDVIRTIGEYHDLIAHYHTAGNPGRHDLDDQQEINYPPIFRAIRNTGYSGFIGQEFVPKGDSLEALKTALELTKSSLNMH